MRTAQMWPIRSELKSRRLHWGGVSSTTTWTWFKELRENNNTRRIYEVNPYVEVYKFRENLYGLFSENLDGMGDQWMYLIDGPEKCLLIDTAYGLGNISALCDELTGGKPIIVVNTHDHFDHAYGNAWFEKVYCHEYLVPYLQTQSPHMWDYIYDALGQNIWVDFPREDLVQYRPYEIVGVKDGHTWDLGGGYEVELIFTGGHAAGHAVFLDKRNRILFTGDNLCTDSCSCGYIDSPVKGPYAEYTEMAFCRDRFKVLVERMGEYDAVFPSHHMNDLDPAVIANILDTLDAYLANPDEYDYETVKYDKDRTYKKVMRFKYIKGFSALRCTY